MSAVVCWLALLALLLLFYAWALWKTGSWRSLRRRDRGGKGKISLHPLAEPFLALLELPGVYRTVFPWLQKPQAQLAQLHGGICSKERLLGWAAHAISLSYLTLLLTGLLGAVANSGSSLALLGGVVALLLPPLRARELSKRAENRRRRIVLELPELLSRLLLLVNAGENVMRALEKCLRRRNGIERDHPLYLELEFALESMKRGETYAGALEEFGRRCAVPEAKLFATTVILNSRRGGETFVASLQELARTLWERRKAMARTLGEQASSKMAFPLAVIFLLILVLVGAPTLLMMST
ncbi:type II secretion system F family protein [Cohnella sp. AR92]|uniref:type II secretion system F family protein n=1 Tax=Cohnella sp. AR92 TaxID=648716 RepID=UPI00131561B6|nr:type II secretion system F family protein [Cohnella sp. AR92]